MQENDFEHQAKQTMDSFKLRPSGAVWPAIEKEIRDKRKRRILLAIPLLAALVGLGYFAWVSTGNDKTDQVSESRLSATQQSKPAHSTADNPHGATSSVSSKKVDSTQRIITVTKLSGNKPATASTEKNINGNLIATKNLSHLPQHAAPSFDINGNSKTGNSLALISQKQNQHLSSSANSSQTFASKTDGKMTIAAVKENYKDKIEKKDSVESSIITRDNIPVVMEDRSFLLSENLLNDHSVALDKLPVVNALHNFKSRKNLIWGFTFSAGGSSRFDHPFKLVETEKATASINSFTGSPVNVGTANNTVGGGLLILPPSRVKIGTAFKLGVLINKSIGRRIELSTGLRYSFSSDHISIGKTIYSANTLTLPDRNYSANAVAQTSLSGIQAQNYTNRYHFIEVPLSVHFNIIRRWKNPLFWNAGVAVSRLLSSNILLYDETWGGLYYKGSNDLVRTQFNLSTGFSISLMSNRQWQWRIGPEVSMNTTSLFQNTADKNKHLVYGGLNLQLLFSTKKHQAATKF